MGALIEAIANVIFYVLTFYLYIVIARAIISWVSPNPYNPIVNFLYMATEPVLRYSRRIIPLIGGTLDLSPILVLIVIVFLRKFLVDTLMQFAQQF